MDFTLQRNTPTNMNNDFNFFRILDKDNKELIHSAVISYLFDADPLFRTELLKLPDIKFCKSQLESNHTVRFSKKSKKPLQGRFDVEAISTDDSNIVVIENKFKSLPDETQLKAYDAIVKKYYKNTILFKYLFCFDKKLINFETKWKILDYKDLLDHIQKNQRKIDSDEERIFIEHYYKSLNDHIESYQKYISDSRELFTLRKPTSAEKFWLNLIYSNLNSKFIGYLTDETLIPSFKKKSNGRTTPLFDFIPKKWTTHGDLCIQLQGDELKFYIYSTDKDKIEKIIQVAKNHIVNDKIKFKKTEKGNRKSSFILKTKISDNINMDKKLDIETLFGLLKKFYTDIDSKVIKNLIAD